MHAAEGILTTRGGMTSHAAVVARGMGKPCVSGAGAIRVDYQAGTMTAGGRVLKKGDIITIDGSTGEVLAGVVAMRQPELSGDFAQLMEWADAARRMRVRANAETPADARAARSFGAEGIGLCRTEHMFFEEDRIVAVREMILADDEAGAPGGARQAPADAARRLRRAVRDHGRAAGDHPPARPAAARVPAEDRRGDRRGGEGDGGRAGEAPRARRTPCTSSTRCSAIAAAASSSPIPEIAEMQARAIFEAAIEVGEKTGKPVLPEIMVPLVAIKAELDRVAALIDKAAEAVAADEAASARDYIVGTMIELPRAALAAGKIAESAEFFSFGTNDLTQTTFGLSRDDAASFLGAYTASGILATDPFVTLDSEGVGELIQIAVERGRETRPDIKLGICGEHGGDPASIAFCEEIGLDYVSCSPFRVPIARLAAAQASLRAAGRQGGPGTA